MNIFLGLIGLHEFFFHLIFPCANIFFVVRPLHTSTYKVNRTTLTVVVDSE